jgi:hypothetical protein
VLLLLLVVGPEQKPERPPGQALTWPLVRETGSEGSVSQRALARPDPGIASAGGEGVAASLDMALLRYSAGAGESLSAAEIRPFQQWRSSRHLLALRDNQRHACCGGWWCGLVAETASSRCSAMSGL